jgi:hypothetical protein
VGAGWTSEGNWWVFNASADVGPEPSSGQGHIYQYAAAIYSKNGQVVSLRQSDPFILI